MADGTREKLAAVARREALRPWHGCTGGMETNLEPIIRLFPRWNVRDADGAWCAAFVYFCLAGAGFEIPYSPDECVSCSLAGCGGFEEFALGDKRIGYHKPVGGFCPGPGDIVLFDNLFEGREHDHIGIVIEAEEDRLLVAEGNVPGTKTSGLVQRETDGHIRAFIRIPDGFCYR